MESPLRGTYVPHCIFPPPTESQIISYHQHFTNLFNFIIGIEKVVFRAKKITFLEFLFVILYELDYNIRTNI